MLLPQRFASTLWIAFLLAVPAHASAPAGYYRSPAIHGDTIVFVAEGDLWRVSISGGTAMRLTSHPGSEYSPAISPDGREVAFTAAYEGATDLYTMPLDGGLPVRRTYGSGRVAVSGWTPDGRVLYATQSYSTLPDAQLVIQDVGRRDVAGAIERVPLAQAADGSYDESGETLYFTRFPFQGSHTKRYRGGTAQQVWKFASGASEAVSLTADYPGTSKHPMWWRGRVYFVSDRDGTMNLWSMSPTGADLRQHTRHDGWDVKSPDLHAGRIVYQLGADLRIHDVAGGADEPLAIVLSSDLDQVREHWVADPYSFLSSTHLSADGERIVLTARGQVFVTPRKQGRLVQVTRERGVRYRDARFMPDGESLIALSDESGEVELWKLPANGVGETEQLTDDGEVLRWEARPSPDGRYVAHTDKNQRLFLLDLSSGKNHEVDRSELGPFEDPAWSADSRWLAYVASADNSFQQIKLYDVDGGTATTVTRDRFDSYGPAWSPDGKWLYFLSDRNLRSVVGHPWGSYQPEPFLDKKSLVYQLALAEDLRSPFSREDELHPVETSGKGEKKAGKKKDGPARVRIDLEGIEDRLIQLPLPAGNYAGLAVTDDALYWTSTRAGEARADLAGGKITGERNAKGQLEVTTIASEIDRFELSGDGKQLLLRKKNAFYVIRAQPEQAELQEHKVDLSRWRVSVVPREEWRQMFDEAWRLERDYFYDRGMHGVDWASMREKYRPLVDRVTTRGELADLLAQMVSELSALHTFVRGGEFRSGKGKVLPSSLGAQLLRDEAAGGYRVQHVYASDPDQPERAAPLARPGVDVVAGDVITRVNGVPTLSAGHIGELLRTQVDRQVLLRVEPADGGEGRDVIVRPISSSRDRDLRYHEWEYTRRQSVDEQGRGEIGYVHLRAMKGSDFTEWAREFYPVFTRKGLIVDVRHNRGGNIDSWILGRLLRRPWFYWSQRVGRRPSWNMQYAFHGHVVVLCDEHTMSDGEAFTEGIRRLEIGTIIGTRTWGGEIWLTSSNRLVDLGIATSAEFGVFGPEGDWLIEGHGVEPDIVVDNLPHESFNGRDAQLEAAIKFLLDKIETEPVEIPEVPSHPDKSSR